MQQDFFPGTNVWEKVDGTGVARELGRMANVWGKMDGTLHSDNLSPGVGDRARVKSGTKK
jgi:hypothetical protein